MSDYIKVTNEKALGSGNSATKATITIDTTTGIDRVAGLLEMMRSVMERVADDEDMPLNWEEDLHTLLAGLREALDPAPPVKQGDFLREYSDHGGKRWHRVVSATAFRRHGKTNATITTDQNSDPHSLVDYVEHVPVS